MLREFTCIVCPKGCKITAHLEKGNDGGQTISTIEGALCPKGKSYVEQELTNPRRNIATSVLVKGGELPLASVRLTAPIPKEHIFAAMDQIKVCVVAAPVAAGTVVIHNLLGYEVDVIVTKPVAAE